MNKNFHVFLIRNLLAAGFAAILSFLIFNQLPEKYTSQAWPYLLIFFTLGNLGLFMLYQRAKEKKLSSFANFFMLATFLKLLVYLAIITVYLLYNRDEAVPFLLSFFIYYIIFTALEVNAVTKKSN